MAEMKGYGFYTAKDEKGNDIQAVQTSDYRVWVNQNPYTGKLKFGNQVIEYKDGFPVTKSTKNTKAKTVKTPTAVSADTIPLPPGVVPGSTPSDGPATDEQSLAAGKKAAAVAAKSLPKVNPATGATSDLFKGKYGVGEALLFDPIYGPELREIKAAYDAGNPTLAADLYAKSKWGRLDSDVQQRYLLKLENEDIYKERLTSWLIGIKKKLVSQGLSADDATLQKYFNDGIDDATIIDQLSSKITAKGAAGTTADSLASLRATARNNGFNLDKDFAGQIDGWLQRIAKGESVDDFARIIRSQAKLGLPEKVGALLDEGLDLANIYAPYRNRMAAILEVTPDSISLDDPLLRSAYGPDKEMSLYDFQRMVRKDSRWQYTDNARQEVADSALKVLQDFGFQG